MGTVRAHFLGGHFQHEIQVRNHRLISDEGPEVGGEDAGPTPHEYLSAALAACTAITLRMYALRKGWALEDAETSVTHVKNESGAFFERTIHLKGNLDEAQKARLLDIANHCPVHKTLSGAIEIKTDLV